LLFGKGRRCGQDTDPLEGVAVDVPFTTAARLKRGVGTPIKTEYGRD